MSAFIRGIGLALLLTGCAMPSTVVRTVDTRPSLAISGAPAGAMLVVDGQNAGRAEAYDGERTDGSPRVLLVEPGTHEIEILDRAGKVIFRQKIFVESETKTIQVH